MIMVGDAFHNFVDGIIIAAAFLTDVNLGIVTALAIIAHEIPQEVGDFLILLQSGYSKMQALAVNLLSSLARQYVAVTTGLGGGSPRLVPGLIAREIQPPQRGHALYVFALPDER
jgi:zinc transporter ZupT